VTSLFGGVLAAAALACAPGPPSAATPPGVVCTMQAVAGLNIAVRDSVTNAPAADGARAVARNGSQEEVLEAMAGATPGLTLIGAWERPGTYTIEITKPGYRTWVRSGVTVAKDECHVQPVRLDARLVPAR
jgi:hypothetical protein